MSETRAIYQTDELLTTEGVAELTGLTARSVLYHIRVDHLPARKMRTHGDGQRGGYYRWLIWPEDAAEFKARLERGEIGQRGGNYGGGRPTVERPMERERDFTHIYIPTSAQERQRIAGVVPADRRLLVLEFAAYAESIAAADDRARKALDWWYSLSDEDKLAGIIKDDWRFSPDWEAD